MRHKMANDAACRQFHLRIAQATGRHMRSQMVNEQGDMRKDPLWTQIESTFTRLRCVRRRRNGINASLTRCRCTTAAGRQRCDAHSP